MVHDFPSNMFINMETSKTPQSTKNQELRGKNGNPERKNPSEYSQTFNELNNKKLPCPPQNSQTLTLYLSQSHISP